MVKPIAQIEAMTVTGYLIKISLLKVVGTATLRYLAQHMYSIVTLQVVFILLSYEAQK
jgi:uncharacterized membrane protein YcaP (DUF421 family)